MLDVHPPHEAAHSWRDILIHLATITIGLFIALSLEAGVESLHNRETVKEARETIRTEISENQKLLQHDVRSIESEKRQMQSDMDILRALRTDPHAPGSLTYAWNWSSMDNSAWQTARDTGAISHMSYDKVQNYADVYGQQELVNDAGRALLRGMTEVEIPLLIEKPPTPLTPAQIDEALHRCATTFVQLQTLGDLIRSLDREYANALKAS